MFFVELLRQRSVAGRRRTAIVFRDIRNWLWGRFGPGVENSLFFLLRASSENPEPVKSQWAWHDQNYFIYLRDEALVEFILIKERFEMER